MVAKTLKGKRVSRGSDFSKKDVDVVVDDFPSLQIDAKYRQRWSHHRYLAEVEEKYCAHPEDIPVLVTKHPRLVGAYVCLPLSAFGILLDVLRELRAESERKGK